MSLLHIVLVSLLAASHPAAPPPPTVVVDADVGMGAFEVRHNRRNRFDHRANGEEQDPNTGCASA